MDKHTLQRTFRNTEELQALADALSRSGVKVRLDGGVGSSVALFASALLEEHGGDQCFILDDKEEAAYFFNDLENLNEGGFTPLFLPASYRIPYGTETSGNAEVQMRTEVLNTVNHPADKPLAIVTYPRALSEKVVTREHLDKNTLIIEKGKEYSVDFLNDLFVELSFDKVDHVREPGQFSVRGGIVDIFSFAADEPYRVEFFGDEVDSIRIFDPISQLSRQRVEQMTVVPNVREKLVKESRCDMLEYLGNRTTVWIKSLRLASERLQESFEKARYIYEEKLEDPEAHIAPDELYMDQEQLSKSLSERSVIEFGSQPFFEAQETVGLDCRPQPSFNKNFDLLFQDLEAKAEEGHQLNILASQQDQVERLYRIIEDKEKEDLNIKIFLLPLSEGFIASRQQLVCYTDHQVFERYHRFRLKEGYKETQQALTIRELNELHPGDYVTHIDHGVGQYSGLETIEVNGKQQEAIRLIYRGNDILYVSIHSLHRIARYSGQEGKQPKIDKLGSNAWKNLKQRTKKKVKELAFDLIQLYAKRKASKGFAFSPDTYLQNELEASFMYEDTPDQAKATADVKKDMEKPHPMDRLVCGDVGFGKTEVAIRAAFKAVADNKQVAVLAPTTILTMQHYKSFAKRLEEFPCSVGLLNRFRSAQEQKETLEKLANGELDIVIGTHKIVGKQIKFKDLGLLVVDEEQKFGVSTKDKLKTLRENVDTLTLTATPIPRTLQFSLMGARDLSIINTPPPNRYPVKTELHSFNEQVIREAVNQEVERGGQVFFVHNRVQNIEKVAEMVRRSCPGVRVAVGHGQMQGKELEQVMLDFIEGYHDVLVSTTIIESGIDIPNANTMIVNDAHMFGLSDLHQLRGRVGRTNKRAFCYLMAPAIHTLTDDARKRLQAIEQFSDLGSGFNIAMRDLDIRGAGDLLGGEQSGFINDIGFEMYQKILDEAVQELKEQEFKELFHQEQEEEQEFVRECQIETDMEVRIPDEYVTSTQERLSLYQQLDNIQDEEELKQFNDELRDRFGPVPEPARGLFNVVRLRWLAREVGFEKLVVRNGKMLGYFVADQSSPYFQSPAFSRVLEYIKNNPREAGMKEKNQKLMMVFQDVDTVEKALAALRPIRETELSEA